MGEVNDCLFHPSNGSFFTAGNDNRIKMFEIIGNSCNKTYVII